MSEIVFGMNGWFYKVNLISKLPRYPWKIKVSVETIKIIGQSCNMTDSLLWDHHFRRNKIAGLDGIGA